MDGMAPEGNTNQLSDDDGYGSGGDGVKVMEAAAGLAAAMEVVEVDGDGGW